MTHLAPLVPPAPALGRGATTLEALSREDWRAHLPAFSDASYTQHWDYAQAAARRIGAQHEAVAICHAGSLVALACVRIKRIPFLGGIAYISGGPLTARSGQLSLALAALRDHYTRDRGLVLRILGPTGDLQWCQNAAADFTAAGFEPTDASRAYRTILVNVARPLPDIRAALAQRWRRHLNFAERQSLTIRSGAPADLLGELGALYRPMVDRKGFSTELDFDFYESLAAALTPTDGFLIHLIEHNAAPVAAMLSSTLGDTTVAILNATSPQGRDLRASYLLHWALLEHAHHAGALWVDLCGIDRHANPGGAQFKEALGGVEILAPGPFQAIPTRLRGSATLCLERAYRRTQGRTRPAKLVPQDAPDDAPPSAL